uniref:Protein kinase domain-containing protein n=1 Tax=Panagrolaimus superbus TaxID=310955 RepID=A0A914YX35_9BILA
MKHDKEIEFIKAFKFQVGPSLQYILIDEERGYGEGAAARHIAGYMKGALLALEELHQMDYLPQDVKPSNFAIDLDDPKKVYLNDYGIVQKIKPGETTDGLIGTKLFASRDALAKTEQFKKSDLGKKLAIFCSLCI